ncbi:beta-glucosidase [Pedobacter sp. HMF7056]|uniref:Beta-glucosidase n=1 Tax=Hufsiella ginkgonis TaxID=2695274 RepID=A0A7K1XXG7_9SPHI|nr:GH1 family beta-glucosidase [Hufsiella ginkgonis]MXV15704.1 beta-glucosidase [Hufsiella ginkgonis]
MQASSFGEKFSWGVSSAACQTEGAYLDDGKGPSIWDTFTDRKGKICNNDHARVACNFYHLYPEDLSIIRQLNIPNFRFSLAWSRIIPGGTGAVNPMGLDYYDRLIDNCLEKGIDPWVTLYHWDLPQALELKGGWTNRDVVSWFSDYVSVCAKRFGDRVGHWMVMNEPMVFTGAGYFLGVHAPGRRGVRNFFPAVHHSVLAMAEGARILKSACPDAEVGSTFSCSMIEPQTTSRWDTAAANRVDALLNRLFIEPALGMGYPVKDVPVLRKLEKYMLPGDDQKMIANLDFAGVQNYTREIVSFSLFTPYVHARLVDAKRRTKDITEMNWEVYPPSIYHMLKKFDAYPGIPKLYVTENGAAFKDVETAGRVHDERRINYLKDYIAQVFKAKQEGCKVEGYFVWTLTDNFEWAEGYRPKFGIVKVDPETQRRTVKDSGRWYGDFLSGR